MHHDLDHHQRARLAIYEAVGNLDLIATLDPYDLLRVAHWVATGNDPDVHTDTVTDAPLELETTTAGDAQPRTWRPAVTN